MKRALSCRTWALCGIMALAICTPLHAKLSVLDSPHNLSVGGGRGRASGLPGVTVPGEQRVCVFCHVPHHAASGTPLWSRDLTPETVEYTPYRSSTLNATPKPDRPQGSSKLCLSCHDGTIALSQYVGSGLSDGLKMPSESSIINPNLTTDLSDDHPISFAYTEALAQKSHLQSPAALPAGVRLEKGFNVECITCHDPHDNQYGNFLVMNNGDPDRPDFVAGSQLCSGCHKPLNWEAGSHNNTEIASLRTACISCHAVHNAPGAVRLLRGEKQADTCLQNCHNGVDPNSANLKGLFVPGLYRHPVDDPVSDPVHDENETLPADKYHVQCVDCHNPHQANAVDAPLASPPLISGRLRGVRKDSLGNAASFEFEVCFRCHAGDNAYKFASVSSTMPNRLIADPNQEHRFDALNPSFHPVTADRRTNGASLLTALQATMTRIYCTDCHNSDQSRKAGGTGPNGPHGSQYEHILIAQYAMPVASAPRAAYNASQYALCFRCHYESYVMDSGSAFANAGVNEHARHVRDRQIPCFACHDPHGTSWRMQATPANSAHLVNFDMGYASSTVLTAPSYLSNAPGTGSCTVICHTVPGNTHEYSPSGSLPKLFIMPGAKTTR